ncbi:hypothetical protein [Micromonospora sp. A202]|uniref:hypothetical protein n=1 Tax=Micromonospora sp. A202 TaxID=2572899 RepID=UPI001153B386|nr:hypothetical protein [Micromonospora sp. A202]
MPPQAVNPAPQWVKRLRPRTQRRPIRQIKPDRWRRASSAAAEPDATAKLSEPVAGWTARSGRLWNRSPLSSTRSTAIGPGRLIFGSDRPVCLLAASYTG